MLTFDGSSNMQCVLFEAADDNIYEFDEILLLELSSSDGSVSLAPFQVNITIVDFDDGL